MKPASLSITLVAGFLLLAGCNSARPRGIASGPGPTTKPLFGPPPRLESAGKAVSPTSAEVEQHILTLQKAHPNLIHIAIPQKTREGRPIYAITLTDPKAPDEEKQHVLIVAGQHGNEESGRMIALALMDWLVSTDGAETLRLQKIAIMPNVNPDGAERDQYDTADGIRPNLDHGPSGPWSPEAKAVEALAHALQPDLYVDMHGRGGAGHSYDMVLYPMTLPYLEDDNILHQIAADMARAGEAAGIPHVTHSLTWPGWSNNGIGENSSTVFHYRQFHSLVFLTETAEHNTLAPPAQLRKAAGLARLKVLLEYGNRRNAFAWYPGYPGNLIGMSSGGFVAVGNTAADRRRSRVAIWTHRDLLENPRPIVPEPPRRKDYIFTCQQDLFSPIGVQVRCAGKMEVESVSLDGKTLSPSQTSGFYSWQDPCSTFIVIAQPGLQRGQHRIHVQFK